MHRALFFLLIHFIFIGSMVACAQAGPKIKVDSDYWDFGEIMEGQIEEKIFHVENIGDKDLVIENAFTSCGCTTVKISSYRLSPHQKAELKVTYNSKGKIKGKDSKDIYITSNDPLNPKIKITIRGYIIENNNQNQEASGIPTISSAELHYRIEQGESTVILDVREENEYIERHIPEAIWFPKSKFDKDDEEVKNKIKKINKNSFIVAYCGAGHRSSYVTKKLREKGYNAFNLDGISFWEKEGYPLVRGPKLPSSREPSIIHLEEAYQHYFLLFKDVDWIDVRNREDYNMGHLKGALSIPLSELEGNLGRISKDKEIVLYCEGTWDGGKCDASMSAGRILINNGFKQGKIKVLEDGYGAWENAGYPLERGEEND